MGFIYEEQTISKERRQCDIGHYCYLQLFQCQKFVSKNRRSYSAFMCQLTEGIDHNLDTLLCIQLWINYLRSFLTTTLKIK